MLLFYYLLFIILYINTYLIFKKFKIKIEACIDPLNEPSINLIKKIGFNLEAQFKENFYHPILKEFRDTNVYCKINPNHIKN